jgi:hypothetical protein
MLLWKMFLEKYFICVLRKLALNIINAIGKVALREKKQFLKSKNR